MTDGPPTPETPVIGADAEDDPLDPKDRRAISAMLGHLGGPPLDRDEEFQFKKAQVAYLHDRGIGLAPEDVMFIEQPAEDAPPWFDVTDAGEVLEDREVIAEGREMMTRYLLGRDHDAAVLAEMSVSELAEVTKAEIGLSGGDDGDAAGGDTIALRGRSRLCPLI